MSEQVLEMALNPRDADLSRLGVPQRIVSYCPTCGEPIPARTGKGRQKIFCSKQCCDRYTYEHRNTKTGPGIRTKVCEYCGKEFTGYRENSHPQRYCSVSCARHAISERRRNNVLGNQSKSESAD